MLHLFTFMAGVLVALIFSWAWQAMTGHSHDRAARAMVEYKAAQENQKLLDEFVEGRLGELARAEIWARMAWIWKESRGWVARTGGSLSWVCLGLFALLYACLWFKALMIPNSHDLRLLLGGRSLLMYVTQEKTP